MLEEFRSELEWTVRAESRYGWENARSRWEKPLTERIAAGRALGGLRIAETETVRNRMLVHFHPSREDAALFREEDRVRLSLNNPDDANFIAATFLGLTEKGLSVAVPKDAILQAREDWSLGEAQFFAKSWFEIVRPHSNPAATCSSPPIQPKGFSADASHGSPPVSTSGGGLRDCPTPIETPVGFSVSPASSTKAASIPAKAKRTCVCRKEAAPTYAAIIPGCSTWVSPAPGSV